VIKENMKVDKDNAESTRSEDLKKRISRHKIDILRINFYEIVEEYKLLRGEMIENIKARSSIELHIIIIIASVMGASLISNRLFFLHFLLLLMLPLLLRWNSLYLANLGINHYIRNFIVPILKLKWEEYSELIRTTSKKRKFKFFYILHAAPALGIIYAAIGLIISTYVFYINFSDILSQIFFVINIGIFFFFIYIMLTITLRHTKYIEPFLTDIDKILQKEIRG
jgi:hypothetical protein